MSRLNQMSARHSLRTPLGHMEGDLSGALISGVWRALRRSWAWGHPDQPSLELPVSVIFILPPPSKVP